MSTRRCGGDLQSPSVKFRHQQLILFRPFENRQFHFCLLAIMSSLVLFSKLHLGDLGGYDDAVYAHEGKWMLATGDWWSVYLNGQLDFDKPPLFIWLEALSMSVFGVSDFAARVPSALLGFGTILLVYFIARELTASYWLPVWAMMIMLCTHFFMRFAMRAMTDVPFTFFFTLALLFYLKSLKQPRHFIWCGFAISLAILTRSILGTIPLGIILIHLIFTGRGRLLQSKYFIVGLVLALGLPIVWFLSQIHLHGSRFLALHFSFTFDNLPLMKGKSLDRLGAGLFQYPIFLVKAYWPWLPLMVLGLWMQAKMMFKSRDSSSSLLVIWVLCVIAPFSLMEFKWLRYIMPVFPAFAILAAIPINNLIGVHSRSIFLKASYALLFLTMIGIALNPKYRVRPEEMRRLAPIAEAATNPERRILLYTEHAPPEAYLFQIIWYTDRHCELLPDPSDAIARLDRDPNTTIIMDKEIFYSSIVRAIPDVQVLGETEGFVCWAKKNYSEAVEARTKVDSGVSQSH